MPAGALVITSSSLPACAALPNRSAAGARAPGRGLGETVGSGRRLRHTRGGAARGERRLLHLGGELAVVVRVGAAGGEQTRLHGRGHGARGGDLRVELLDLAQGQPVAHAVFPAERLVGHDAGLVGLDDLAVAHRALVAVGDVHRPLVAAALAGVVEATGIGRRLARGGAAVAVDHDGGAALLAANLDDLALDLVVRDRVLGRAGLARDLHPRTMVARCSPYVRFSVLGLRARHPGRRQVGARYAPGARL
jgi:hypothetical protein